MKKFIITEEERSRILGMHQSATARQYLNEDDSSIIINLTLTLKYNIDPATKQKDYLDLVYFNMPINTSGPEAKKNNQFTGNLYSGVDTINIDGVSYKPIKQSKTNTDVTGHIGMKEDLFKKSLLPYVGKGQQLQIKNVQVMPFVVGTDGKIVSSSTLHNVNLTVVEQLSTQTTTTPTVKKP